MAELGFDITAVAPKILTSEAVQTSDVLILTGCGDTYPYFPAVFFRDWKLADPANQSVGMVRAIRDDIADLVRELITQLLPTTTTRRELGRISNPAGVLSVSQMRARLPAWSTYTTGG